MKKFYFVLFLIVCLGIEAKAQSFDEEDLMGYWVRTGEMAPIDDFILSIDSIALGTKMWVIWYYNDYEHQWGSDERYSTGYFFGKWNEELIDRGGAGNDYVHDFFISNGNKLHISVGDDFTLIFKILNLSTTEMVLQPLGSTNKITFKHVENFSTGINAPQMDTNTNNYKAIYNLQGQKLNRRSKGVNIIKPQGQKVRKEVVVEE